jgi:hypothetical protein
VDGQYKLEDGSKVGIAGGARGARPPAGGKPAGDSPE